MKFDPDSHYVKVRGMGKIHYEQNGHKFSAGYEDLGPLNGKKPPAKETDDNKKDVRERARAKIAKKKTKKKASKKVAKGDLDGYRGKETPDAVSSAEKEDEAARLAEDNA